MSKVLYNVISERRFELGWTQADLSEASGVNVNTIKQIESGRIESSVVNLTSISVALRLKLKDIYLKNFKNTNVIAITNNKGGSGKTSVASNLGYVLTTMKKKVLLIDSDMQMNLTQCFDIEDNLDKSIYSAFEKEADLTDYISSTDFPGLDIIISDYEMATCDMMLFAKYQRESVFRKMLREVINNGLYDFILIDTNPNLGITNLNIFVTSDFAIIPVELSKFGIKGLGTIQRFFQTAVKDINPDFEILGVLLNKVDKREAITEVATEVIEEVFGEKLFKTQIGIDASIKKSQWEGIPVNVYEKSSRSSKQYVSLAKEVLKHV